MAGLTVLITFTSHLFERLSSSTVDSEVEDGSLWVGLLFWWGSVLIYSMNDDVLLQLELSVGLSFTVDFRTWMNGDILLLQLGLADGLASVGYGRLGDPAEKVGENPAKRIFLATGWVRR